MSISFRILLCYATVLLACSGTSSCVPEEPQAPGQQAIALEAGVPFCLSVKDNTLHFATAADYFATIDAMATMEANALDTWEAGIGFRSMYTDIGAAYTALNLAETQEEFEAVRDAHADLLYTEGSIEPRVPATIYQRTTSRSGAFYIDGRAYRVVGTQLISSMEEGVKAKALDLESPHVKATSYIMGTKAQKAAGHERVRCKEQDLNNCTFIQGITKRQKVQDKRLVYAQLRAYNMNVTIAPNLQSWKLYIELKVLGRKYQSWSCNWVNYETNINVTHTEITFDEPRPTGTLPDGTNSFTFIEKSLDSNWGAATVNSAREYVKPYVGPTIISHLEDMPIFGPEGETNSDAIEVLKATFLRFKTTGVETWVTQTCP